MDESKKELFTALSMAQKEIKGAQMDSKNPFFNSKYSSLESVWAAARGPLTNNGLSVTQICEHEGDKIILVTMLCHSSGSVIESRLPLAFKHGTKELESALIRLTKLGVQATEAFSFLVKSVTPQDVGGSISYARRYALMAIVGICPTAKEEDDGESLMKREPEVITSVQKTELELLVNGSSELRSRFLKWMNLSSFDQMPYVDFAKCKTALEKHLAKREEKTKEQTKAKEPAK